MFELKAAAEAVNTDASVTPGRISQSSPSVTPWRERTALRVPRESVATGSPLRSLAAQHTR